MLGPLLTCASTVQQSVKRDSPQVITHSFHAKLHYSTILAQKRRMETQAKNLLLS